MSLSAPVPLGIAGAGRVAQALGRLLAQRGQPVAAFASRDPEHARAAARSVPGAAAVSYADLPGLAGHIVIAVPDDAIADVAASLTGARVAVHTCGSRGSEELAVLRRTGTACGALHPLQTFPDPEAGVRCPPGAFFAIEGDPEAVEWAEGIVRRLEGTPLFIAAGARPLYHAAAVLASNCVVALVDSAVRLMGLAGIPSGQALKALAPLFLAAAGNVVQDGPEAALTGPVERGDATTVSTHLRALTGAPEPLPAIYRSLGLAALEIARRKGLPPARADQLEELLRREEPNA